MSRALASPLPGKLVSLAVKPGDAVELGQELAVVEAMKMANVLRSPRKGVVRAVKAKAGATLAVDELILEFE
jgi:propionyl-CoA carboxylase alpha chain